ncbi:MAG: vitamin B12-dependent ribonucleotide reductase [Clostridiaceae bacterium]|mgnify:CR=1 FL=1|nr:vitamin B12-dependent ribonucleotide reductase [Clostridiaceae bacterium]
MGAKVNGENVKTKIKEQNSLSQLITRKFTKELENNPDKTVYDLFEWEKRDVIIKDYKTGKTLTDLRDLEFPAHYSQQAADIIASKYFRKAGVNTKEGHETSMRQVAHRMVIFWVTQLVEEGMIDEEKSDILYDELVYALLNQMFAPNSPQWFNTGLEQAYGITGGQSELFYYDPAQGKVVMSDDTYTRTQASACFILSIEDKLLGRHSISEHYVTETKLFKGGSGTGSNFSAVRGEGEALSGGGQSSGLMSFLRGLDRNAGAIKSGGTTRRAAKMVCLDVDHPEIEEFMSWKAKEEDKVIALNKMGYDGDIDGEAYQTVSGQNSNNSVRFSDEFMQKVANLDQNPDATLTLKGRVDNSVDKEVSVQKLWDVFNESAWRCADPAPQFDDTFNAWHTCPAGEDGKYGAKYNRINSTNPCGEYAFLDDTSCNLASINLLKFYDFETNQFDLDAYIYVIELCQLVLEASIIGGQFPTEEIARKTYLFRSTGLGVANLASLLMSLGYPYDSEEARTLGATLVSLLTGRSYRVSALMAKELGTFEKYGINEQHMMRVIRNHSRAAGARTDEPEGISYELPVIDHQLMTEMGFEALSKELVTTWQEAEAFGKEYGYRNAQVSVIAPTGTISFAMDCASTSIEPFFSHVTYKKLVGGGFMELVNPMLETGLRSLGYSETEIEEIVDYIMRKENDRIVDGKIEGAPHLKDEHLAVFDTANQCGTGERFIHYMGHVKMVAALTPMVSGAISKTVNLPGTATVEDFKDVALKSWQLGIKGITLYRDGSKFAQPLNVNLDVEQAVDLPFDELSYQQLVDVATNLKSENETLEKELKTIPQASSEYEKSIIGEKEQASQREKLIGIRSGRTHPAKIEDVKIYTTVNRNEDGDISEIYITTDREGTTIMGLLNSLSKTISVMLQYKIPAHSIAKMLRGQKYEPYGFVSRHPNIKYCSSISDLISKIIDLEIGDYTRVQVKPSKEQVTQLQKEGSIGFIGSALDREHLDSSPMISQVGFEEYVHEDAVDAAKHGERVYDGSTCPNCSSARMVQNGTCMVCLDCGTTTGCS